jgi:Fe/S biogenesis protein NfuA
MTQLSGSVEAVTIIEITDIALEQILALREQESIDGLSLGVRIAGVGHQGFIYETAFLRPEDVEHAEHHIESHGDLSVAIPPDSVDNLRGSVLDISSDPAAPGLVLRNPNPASPTVGGPEIPDIELTGTVEERVRQLLDKAINPSIASHGGYASMAKVEDHIAFIEMGGGCQGCGLAAMTLRQGIETAIKQHVPEIIEVVDVTNHDAGENPFYS